MKILVEGMVLVGKDGQITLYGFEVDGTEAELKQEGMRRVLLAAQSCLLPVPAVTHRGCTETHDLTPLDASRYPDTPEGFQLLTDHLDALTREMIRRGMPDSEIEGNLQQVMALPFPRAWRPMLQYQFGPDRIAYLRNL